MSAAMDPRRRFLRPMTLPPSADDPGAAGGELDELDVFDTALDEVDVPTKHSRPQPVVPPPQTLYRTSSGGGVRRGAAKPGILAALLEGDEEEGPIPLQRKLSIPEVGRPVRGTGFSQSLPAERMYSQSAPRNVPVAPGKGGKSGGGGEGSDGEDGDGMLPPHEIVARRNLAASPFTTFSMLEGQGRTLKGRDLRRVRNAVLSRTGFLD